MDNSTLRLFGLTEEDMEAVNSVEVYPDNWNSFMLFDFLSTQWRATSSGVIGLDYNVIPLGVKMLGIREEDEIDAIDGLRVMESTAINLMNNNNNSK